MRITYSRQKKRSPEEQAEWDARGRELFARTMELSKLDRPLTLKEQEEIGLPTEPELVISFPQLRIYETPVKQTKKTRARIPAEPTKGKEAINKKDK